jgi:hypothetical protein
VDDVRYDCAGQWPAHTEKKQRCRLCIKVYSRVKARSVRKVSVSLKIEELLYGIPHKTLKSKYFCTLLCVFGNIELF